jgi:hypothetical protein
VADQIEDLFAELRADAMRQIRPPGADRARRTVRRRRTATVSAAVVLLVMLGGTVALLGFPARTTTPANHGRLPETDLDRLTGVADRAVNASNPGPAVFARRGPVTGGETATEQIYLGEINLQLACAGTGSVTLLVRGTPGSENNTTKRTEVARLTAQCSAEPLPAGTKFVLGQFLDITVELVDTGSARGNAGFAYRATSDTGRPAARGGLGNDPQDALQLSNDLPAGSGWGGGGDLIGRRVETGFERLDGDFRLAVACAGTGTLHVEVRPARKTTAAKTRSVVCRYPPQREDLVLGVVRDEVTLSLRYESSSPAPARIAYQVLPR